MIDQGELTPVPDYIKQAEPPITERQYKFLIALLEGKDIDHAPFLNQYSREEWIERAAEIGKAEASQMISGLVGLPDRVRTRSREGTNAMPSPEELPKGRYAIDGYIKDNPIRFFNVWRGSRNPEYVQLYQQFGPNDEEVPFKLAIAICQEIVRAGSLKCAQRYGQEIGSCFACGLRLTNRISRELGIGPICGGRAFGDDFKVKQKTARQELIDQGLDPDESVEEEA